MIFGKGKGEEKERGKRCVVLVNGKCGECRFAFTGHYAVDRSVSFLWISRGAELGGPYLVRVRPRFGLGYLI